MNDGALRISDRGLRIEESEGTPFDEQRYIALLYQLRESWEAGVLPREALRLFLTMSTGAVIEIIKQRQRATNAERLSHREH